MDKDKEPCANKNHEYANTAPLPTSPKSAIDLGEEWTVSEQNEQFSDPYNVGFQAAPSTQPTYLFTNLGSRKDTPPSPQLKSRLRRGKINIQIQKYELIDWLTFWAYICKMVGTPGLRMNRDNNDQA